MMIESKIYECDGGSLLIGNEKSRVSIPNGYGDGRFDVTVFDFDEDKHILLPEKYEFVANVRGDEINIYNYDCLLEHELKDNILFTLSGEYAVYRYKGSMYLEKWH